MWEGFGDRTKTATYWPPNSSGYHSLSFPFSWAAQPGGPGSAGTWFSFQHLLSKLYNNLTSTYFLRASHLYSIQPVDSQGYPLIPRYLRPDAPVIYTGAFLLLTAWPGSIYNMYTNKWALACLKMLSTNNAFTNNMCIERIWHEITYKIWYAIKPKLTKSNIFDIYVRCAFNKFPDFFV